MSILAGANDEANNAQGAGPFTRLVPVRRLGAERTVFLTRRHVFKLPGRWTFAHWRWWWPSLLRGLLSNI